MNKHLRHFLLSTAIGISVLFFFMVLNYLNGGTINTEWFTNGLVIAASYTYPLYYVSAYSFQAIKNIGNRYNISPWKAILIGFPFVIVANMGMIILMQYVLKEFIYPDVQITFGNNLWDNIKIPLWISLTIGAVFYIYNFIQGNNKSQLEQKTTEATIISQQHEALKAQIGPHFLFNSLNVLSGLVEENPDKAQDFIANLAHIYRYVLDQKNKDWVPITEEIRFAYTYLDLVQTRFEKGLKVHIDDKLRNSDYLIAPLTLQLLLENCIKHNAISREQPLEIQIFQENQHLVVTNNLNSKRVNRSRKGMGLQHLSSRYEEIQEQVLIEKTDNQFSVKTPLITQKTIEMRTQENYSNQELQEAREEVKQRMGFYANLISYIVVCTFLVVLNLYNGGYFWAIWPIMGWGIGVVSHGLGVFYFNNKGTTGFQWQERQARKLLKKRKPSNN